MQVVAQTVLDLHRVQFNRESYWQKHSQRQEEDLVDLFLLSISACCSHLYRKIMTRKYVWGGMSGSVFHHSTWDSQEHTAALWLQIWAQFLSWDTLPVPPSCQAPWLTSPSHRLGNKRGSSALMVGGFCTSLCHQYNLAPSDQNIKGTFVGNVTICVIWGLSVSTYQKSPC